MEIDITNELAAIQSNVLEDLNKVKVSFYNPITPHVTQVIPVMARSVPTQCNYLELVCVSQIRIYLHTVNPALPLRSANRPTIIPQTSTS